MALYLREEDVERLLPMGDLIHALEEAFRLLAIGKAVNRPRDRVILGKEVLHVMSAGIREFGVMGLKSYATTPRGTRFVVLLYRIEDGELLAVIEADLLGQLRTGAASAVATKYMSRPESGSVGIIGSGKQARTQLRGVCAVRPIALVKAYSRNPERCAAFAEEMVQTLGVQVEAVKSAEEAVEGGDILITATTASQPVLRGSWLRPGVHINAIGSNWAHKQEVDIETVSRSHIVVVDSREQARIESGDLIAAANAGKLNWEEVVELADVVAGRAPGRRSSEEITLFESQGIALEDVTAAKLVYDRAQDLGVGQVL
ncbi:MAG: ornithine cyclodeaminase family protein [Armatimonadota bacterium]|nr:ornithine cyclodeaminase family protein [Armatimonadota bacterium]MDR5702608.1 ornithine cyclodeaminase family protein [Armatimonadota bacterium]MDR7434124.1 ornithine cyclodeaminase family protein [Armatimonadota bacterium]